VGSSLCASRRSNRRSRSHRRRRRAPRAALQICDTRAPRAPGATFTGAAAQGRVAVTAAGLEDRSKLRARCCQWTIVALIAAAIPIVVSIEAPQTDPRPQREAPASLRPRVRPGRPGARAPGASPGSSTNWPWMHSSSERSARGPPGRTRGELEGDRSGQTLRKTCGRPSCTTTRSSRDVLQEPGSASRTLRESHA
jgi:hypothetical protein